MALRKPGTPLTNDEWTLLISYYLTQPERTHTDSHPKCVAFARKIGLSPQTVDMSLRNIKAHATRNAGLRKGARRMKELSDRYQANPVLLRRDQKEALQRIVQGRRGSSEDALRRLRKFNSRWRNEAAPARTRIQRQFDRPSRARADLMAVVGTDCQVCGVEAFPTKSDGSYAEAHHVDELACQSPGNLCTDNVLVVCPTCHAKLHHAPLTVRMRGDRILLDLAGKRFTVRRNSEANLKRRLSPP